jgi:hypothetical protein
MKMTKELALASKIEAVVISGDLSKLNPQERVDYYQAVCRSVGLNPLTRPFDYIVLNGKLTLYARKDATDQIRKNDKISITDLNRSLVDDILEVVARAETPDGRTDIDIGAVNLKGLAGDKRANAIMKAVTKSKRRVTLSISGLGFLDETEIEMNPDAKVVTVTEEGEIVDEPTSGNGNRPYSPESLKNKFAASIEDYAEKGWKPKENDANMVAVNLELCFAGDPNSEDMRKTVMNYLVSKASTKLLTDAEIIAFKKWLNSRPDDGGEWHPDPMAIQEAKTAYTFALKAEGQQELISE